MDPWKTLTTDYEHSRAREDSLDQLMEWDAQRSLIGPVEGKTVLDIGCGNGEKAIELARDHGATSVVGVDIGAQFLPPPDDVDVTLLPGDLSKLDEIPALNDRRFDVVLFLQSFAYAYHTVGPYSYPSRWNEDVTITHTTDTFSSIHNSLTDNGFRVERVLEPQLSDEKKQRFPHKQAWLAQYVGIIIFRARPV